MHKLPGISGVIIEGTVARWNANVMSINRQVTIVMYQVLNKRPDALEPLTSLWLRVKQEDSQNSPELKDALAIVGDKIGLGDSR